MDELRQTGLKQAATSPVGVNPVTGVTKLRDIFIVVVIPFVVPAMVLPAANGSSSLTLTNLAFGFVAVAVAGVARAVTSRADEWSVFVLIALTSVCFQTALAVVSDTSEASGRLTDVALRETERPKPRLTVIHDAAVAVNDAAPSAFQWTWCLAIGAAIVILSVELIRREK